MDERREHGLHQTLPQSFREQVLNQSEPQPLGPETVKNAGVSDESEDLTAWLLTSRTKTGRPKSVRLPRSLMARSADSRSAYSTMLHRCSNSMSIVYSGESER